MDRVFPSFSYEPINQINFQFCQQLESGKNKQLPTQKLSHKICDSAKQKK